MRYDEFRDKSFDQIVQERLAWYRNNPDEIGLGGLFMWAGLESIASGRLVDPPVEELKAYLRPEVVWEVPGWPREELGYRMGEVADCTLFAIALGDRALMQELKAVWSMPPAESEWQEIAQLQLDLGLTGETPVCTEDDIDAYFKLHFLDEENTAHQAWAALFLGDKEGARAALELHRADLAARASRWSSTRGDAAYHILLVSSRILRLNVRAIEAVLDRVARTDP